MSDKDVELQAIITRFRAYQLGSKGSSFSYFSENNFTLVEARLNDMNEPSLDEELGICNKKSIDCLHITSWDQDHCSCGDLEKILEKYTPSKIEYPGYSPHTDNGINALAIIKKYNQNRAYSKIKKIDPPYIKSLTTSKGVGYSDIYLHPREIVDHSNDNSTVKVFRSGMFNVASLGDIESSNISSMLRMTRVFSQEIDVLILAHHGADVDANSKSFFRIVKPQVAICTSNYDNQYEHPVKRVQNDLHDLDIPIFTTKTGDVIIESSGSHIKTFTIKNYISNGDKLSRTETFTSKKFSLLRNNQDTLRNIRTPGQKAPKK
ncbi:ComEC/Rec2 family competence protein [Aeromonas veronii]|uniref:ComEC/Rec2 family competence protein n=1 Tax=Aeromonas veronii TaxID=654 RepID=UPI001115D9A6|nr:hypothetical protein [Aeromonas veronii]TNI53762.1 hypothetical protein CF125_12810 [Aeromonas veronii]